jgi:hypothetical protein
LNRAKVVSIQSFPRSVVPAFVVPAFRRPNFFRIDFYVKIEKFLQKWIPHHFLGGRVPKNIFFRRSRLSPLNFFSKFLQAEIRKQIFLKIEKSSIFEFPDPKIGGDRSLWLGLKFNFYPV